MALTNEQREAAELIAKGEMTQKAIADAIGVTPRTIRNWQDDPEFKSEVSRMSVDSVDSALFQRIVSKGDPQAIKLWYQRHGYLQGEDENEMMNRVLQMTPEEREQIERSIVESVLAGTSEVRDLPMLEELRSMAAVGQDDRRSRQPG